MFPIVPRSSPIPVAIDFEPCFSPQQLDTLEHLASEAHEEGALVDDVLKTLVEPPARLRKSSVRFLQMEEANAWLYAIVAGVAAVANAQQFRFDVTGLGEQIQLARYEAKNSGGYGWHQDFGAEVSRKLSITIQLTDPDKYAGGDLQIMKTGTEALTATRKRGAVIVFPSYQLHRVAPVSDGVRHSLVAWVSGPAFR